MHWSHLYGFSPVWLLWCMLSLLLYMQKDLIVLASTLFESDVSLYNHLWNRFIIIGIGVKVLSTMYFMIFLVKTSKIDFTWNRTPSGIKTINSLTIHAYKLHVIWILLGGQWNFMKLYGDRRFLTFRIQWNLTPINLLTWWNSTELRFYPSFLRK